MPTIQTLESTAEYAKFVFEPLERGYGHTIGNALRRVLMGSIPGAAINAVKIVKVFHEFSPIPGLKEDTTEFLLNLKDLAISVRSDLIFDEDLECKIDVKGAGRVTGADVTCPEGVEVVNPECYLATISGADATLKVDLFVGRGSGYMLPERQEKYKGVIGFIPFGAQYTPVRKANYIVEQTRVGQRTDYERLVLEIWTNGSVPPTDAVTQASQILDKYLRFFFELGHAGIVDSFIAGDEFAPELSHVPEIKLEELEFSQRTFNCLRRAGIMNLRQLAAVNEGDLTSIRGFGRKSLTEVREKLIEHEIEIKPAKGGFVNFDLLDDEDL